MSRRLKVLAACILTLIFLGLCVHLYWLDGILGAAAELTVGQTKFAAGYREYKFCRIVPGMTAKQVMELLGNPCERTNMDSGEQVWLYTRPRVLDRTGTGPDCHYTVRYVGMVNGIVTETHHEFYLD